MGPLPITLRQPHLQLAYVVDSMDYLQKIAHETLQEKVYRHIRQGLIDGQFAPGSVLTIRGLADQLGTSVMPVREALQKLVAEQALHLQPNRSVCVPVLSLEKFIDICDTRLIVEGAAAGTAATSAEKGDVARMMAIAEEAEAAFVAEDASLALRKNREFHFSVYAAARHETLLQIIEMLWVRIGPYMLAHLKAQIARSESSEKPKGTHRRIVQAIRTKHAAQAQAAMSADIQNLVDWYRRHLTEISKRDSHPSKSR